MAPKGALGARKQYADRPDGNAEGRGNLRVRVPGMAQQQTLALSFRNLGQRLSHSRALFLADQHARRATHIVVGRLVISALQASDAIDARACTPGRAQAIERQGWIRPILGQVPEITSEQRMCVRVRLFASYREAAGTARLEVPLPDGARVSDLIDVLAVRLPAVRTAPGMVAVNHTYVGADFTLHDGDEAAFIPPVSGGR